MNPALIFELLFVAYEFLFEELIKYLEIYLIETKNFWLRLNFSYIYQKIYHYQELRKLQNWCNDIIAKYPNQVFDSEYFTLLPESALISLIERDDLQLEEVKIWNYVIKWGIAQNLGLPSDLKDWTDENFLTLKNTLKNCLPFIRYFHIPGEDVYHHVQSYKQILEKTLWKNIKMRFMSPNHPVSSIIPPPRIILTPALPIRTAEQFPTVIRPTLPIRGTEQSSNFNRPKLLTRRAEPKLPKRKKAEQIRLTLPNRRANQSSNIISNEHLAEIASWIDRKANTYSLTNNPYEFKLILRGSRDGFTRNSFWNLCNQQTNVIVVMKVKGTDEILGGYNPIGWEKPRGRRYETKRCDDSFIFSLKNGTIRNSILSRVETSKDAICCNPNYGPIFSGGIIMGNNFNRDNGCLLYSNGSYEKSIRDFIGLSYFSVDEYEIFKVYEKDL
ncbi:hypothetical protein C2G38_2116230 [Gigaspora rosea]|uniref:TLDc domain-containing protein n=1 Tax=Gigaspora rosea TaxID=44941 RepID=A0A397UB98_9GLOM|nr:hypothetical protein C2G38_2116230 [Gigaspora rosea]